MHCELLSTKESRSNIQVESIVDYAPSDSIAAKNGTSKVLSIRPLGWHAHGVRVPSQRQIVRAARIQLLGPFPAFLAEARIPLSPLQAMSKKKALAVPDPEHHFRTTLSAGGEGGNVCWMLVQGGRGESLCWIAYGRKGHKGDRGECLLGCVWGNMGGREERLLGCSRWVWCVCVCV